LSLGLEARLGGPPGAPATPSLTWWLGAAAAAPSSSGFPVPRQRREEDTRVVPVVPIRSFSLCCSICVPDCPDLSGVRQSLVRGVLGRRGASRLPRNGGLRDARKRHPGEGRTSPSRPCATLRCRCES
jgi:hypothetical protein